MAAIVRNVRRAGAMWNGRRCFAIPPVLQRPVSALRSIWAPGSRSSIRFRTKPEARKITCSRSSCIPVPPRILEACRPISGSIAGALRRSAFIKPPLDRRSHGLLAAVLCLPQQQSAYLSLSVAKSFGSAVAARIEATRVAGCRTLAPLLSNPSVSRTAFRLDVAVALLRFRSSIEADRLALYRGDFFQLTPSVLGDVAAAYDRAALISWQPPLREAYVRHLTSLMSPGHANAARRRRIPARARR